MGISPGSGQTVFSVDLNSPPIGDVTDIDQPAGAAERFLR
jgi:hypothetical protein